MSSGEDRDQMRLLVERLGGSTWLINKSLLIGFATEKGCSITEYRNSEMMPRIPFLLALLLALCCSVESFKLHTGMRARFALKFGLPPAGDYSSEATQKAMLAARNCAASGLSPGAGLATAEEQAEV